jgi:hypothetical protein
MTRGIRKQGSESGFVRRYRRRRALSGVASITATVVWLVGGAAAQSLSSSNLFAGYSFVGANLISGQHANLIGWAISAEKKFLPYVGVVADFSGDYGSKNLPAIAPCPSFPAQCLVNSSVSEHFFQGGLRGSFVVSRVRPFVEVLFGAVHLSESGPSVSNSRNLFTETFDAGFDCRVTHRLGWRLDVGVVESGFETTKEESFRGSTGVVVRF